MAAENDMTLGTQLMGAVVGGLSAMFAVGVTPPASRREAMVRVAFGVFVIYASTGWALEKMNTPCTVNNVLMYALVIGSLGWFLFTAAVKLCANSPLTVLRFLAGAVIGPLAKALPIQYPQQNPPTDGGQK